LATEPIIGILSGQGFTTAILSSPMQGLDAKNTSNAER